MEKYQFVIVRFGLVYKKCRFVAPELAGLLLAVSVGRS